MCYMKRHTHRIGVRELRQNLSVYLRRVTSGETLEVTDRGRPVAILGPRKEAEGILARMIAAGRATAPAGNLLELGVPRRARRRTPSLSDALHAEREERL
jgi:prevent-host-death family protein